MSWMMTVSLYFYWFVFWGLNGLDKVLDRTYLILFTWYGKNRTDQFSVYFERLGWSENVYTSLMFLLFVIEMLIALIFLWSICVIFRFRQPDRPTPNIAVKLPVMLSVLCFVGFSAWDVVVGDRAELLEHATYIVALGTTYITARLEITEI